jgi:AraC-like DNA-binding protein
MSLENLFLDPKINLNKVALETEISAQKISNAINRHYNMNFFHYINSLRIDYACQLLQDKKHHNYTLIAIANDSGFNSKTTFNTRFKEKMNMTPSAYRKQFLD